MPSMNLCPKEIADLFTFAEDEADLILPRPAFRGPILRGALRAAVEKAWFMQSLPICIVHSHEVCLEGAASQGGQAKSRAATRQTTTLHFACQLGALARRQPQRRKMARHRPQRREILSGNDRNSTQKSPPERCRPHVSLAKWALTGPSLDPSLAA